MIALIPMMGLGSRFINSGYSEYKSLIKINSKPLITKIFGELKRKFTNIYIVCNPETAKQLRSFFDNELVIIEVHGETRGAAETIFKAYDFLPDNEQIVCIDCDTIFYESAINKIKNGNFVLTFEDKDKTGLYSYVTINDNNDILDIQEKIAISNIANAGIYVFENKYLIKYAFEQIVTTINSELYISVLVKNLIDHGIIFKTIDITNEFVCCGTPHQLKIFSKNDIKNNKYKICFDIDGTLIYDLYKNPKKIEKNVKFCNEAFKKGHHIILHTARGMLSTNANKLLIEEKRSYIKNILAKNNILYHDLILMKPYADLYIDDKAIPAHKDLEKETGIYLFEDHNPRIHNQIIVDNQKIIKIGDLKGESYYYNNISFELKKFFPIIYESSESKIIMERINFPSYSSLLLSNKLTKEDIITLLHNISELQKTKNIENINLNWGYNEKIITRFEIFADFYKTINIDINKFIKIIDCLKNFSFGIIHGDPVFTNVFKDKLNCKFIDVRGIWENQPSIYGDIFYDYAKILQSLYGYDYVLHNEIIQDNYLKILREHFFKEIKHIIKNIDIEELIFKTKLMYVSLLPLHKENLQRCKKFIGIMNKL